MAERNDTGKEGELIAQSCLREKGYTVLHTNWRWQHYELDIVAIDNGWLVVVEVKTRAADYLLSPEEAVDKKKIKRLTAAADAYIRLNRISLPVRFDIITIIRSGEGYRIEHLDDAFLAPGR